MKLLQRLCLLLSLLGCTLHAEVIEADLLIVGGDESGCAAAVQAARLGVKRIVLTNDIQWLGGQFATQGIGPVDEWTLVDGRRVNFPRSGPFLEIMERIRAHNRHTYGVATPGNAWCGTDTIEPKAAARIFEEWLAPYTEKGNGQIRVLRPWEPMSVQVEKGRVGGVTFARPDKPTETLEVKAALTIDSSDWGDVIRLSGASYMAGPDLRSRFGEPSAPEKLESGGNQEMNPLTWCPLLREAGADNTIPKPARYDERSFADWKGTPPWRDWDGSGGIYNFAGWCIYTHRRLIDRHHHQLAAGTEAVILNWPAHDYPLSTLPAHVIDALEKSEPGASRKNIVDLTPAQRRVVFEDAKARALEFVYFLQTAVHLRMGDFPQSFRYMKFAEDYGTSDRLPPKPYIREGLRLDALHVLREQDVRTDARKPLWARAMVPDGVFGYQFEIDFHPTRRKFVTDDPTQPWQPKHCAMLDGLDEMNHFAHERIGDPEITTRVAQYEMAFKLQASVPELTDLSQEPQSVLDLYGPDVQRKGSFAYNCLLARRMAERGVRFVQLMHAGWDQHGNLPTQLPIQCRDTDQPSAALVQDLKARGLLDDTLVIWGGEFGRTPFVQGDLANPKAHGRDHHPRAFTMWLAGGGVKRGCIYGSSDDFAYHAAENPVHIRDLQATLMHLCGIDHDRLTYRHQGLDFKPTGVEEAHVVKGILA